MRVTALTAIAIAVAMVVWRSADLDCVKAIALFLGLEGTALLASALSPPYDEMEVPQPKGILGRILWQFGEGNDLAYPIRYNPVYFYLGLLLLALSMVLTAI